MQCLREVLHAPVQTPHSWARRGGPWCTLHGHRVPPSAGAWSPPCPASSLTPASGVVKLASLSYNDNRFYVMFIVFNKYNWKWQVVKYLREKKLSEKSIWEFIMVEKRMQLHQIRFNIKKALFKTNNWNTVKSSNSVGTKFRGLTTSDIFVDN